MARGQLDDKAVLVYLRAKRAALDQAIAALEGKTGELPATLNGSGTYQEIEADSFVGMNIATASAKYLKLVGRPARTTEDIYGALTKGGLPHFSKGSVATILQRIHNQGGDIVKVSKGVWGLAEWYPNRPKPASKKKSEGEVEEEENGKTTKKGTKSSS